MRLEPQAAVAEVHALAPPPPRIADIVSAVAEVFGVTPGEILSQRRTAWIVAARQAAMHLALVHTGHSASTVARALRRDRSSVLHGARVIGDRAAEDPKLAHRLALAERRILQPTGIPQ